jgi:amino acid adenylation domain-containing protein
MQQAPQNNIGVHQLIEGHAAKKPNAIALSYNDISLSYGILNKYANQLAHCLLAAGANVGTMIAICLDRSVDMVISILATLKIGAVYVAIDSDHPKERVDYILEESKAKILLTQQRLLKNYSHLDTIISFDRDWSTIEKFPSVNPELVFHPSCLAYLLYTSGSTGKPKGVVVSHLNLLHAYSGWKEIYGLENQHDSHLQMANFAFDVFTGDMIRALCSGGTLVLCPREILLQPEKLYELMIHQHITCAEFVPTVLRRMLEFIEATKKTLSFMRLLICGSDNWAIHEYSRLQQICGPQTRVINSYGLTEATIDSTYFEDPLSAQHYLQDDAVPIGKPFPNTQIYILNAQLEPVSDGMMGEIYIGGAGVAQGYWSRPELTAQKFIKDPFSSNPNDRLYKTGDLGRFLATGQIELLGRSDTQIKLRGMRIELTDIENALNHHEAIRESLVTLTRDGANHKRLLAYIVLEQGLIPNAGDLRNFLQTKLPRYMIPSWFVKLERIPTTANGKLDRKALLKVSNVISANDYSKDVVLPQSLIEKQMLKIWQTLLPIQNISIHDHFYDIGGDSLLLARLITQIEHDFLVQLHSCQLTHDLTIAALSKYIIES